MLVACTNPSSSQSDQDQDAEQEQQTTKEVEKKEKKETNTEEQQKQTSKDIYDKLIKALKDVDSMNFVMDINQTTTMLNQDLQWTSQESIDTDIIFSPLAMYQKMQVDINSEKHLLELYLTEEDIYMYESEEETWYTFSEDFHEEMLEDSGEDVAIVNDFVAYKKFADKFDVKETENEYILNLASSGVAFKTIVMELAYEDLLMSLELDEEEDIQLDAVDIEKIHISIVLDKNSYEPKQLDVDLTIFAEVEGEEVRFQQKNATTINKLNEIENIVIPEDVIDQALFLE